MPFAEERAKELRSLVTEVRASQPFARAPQLQRLLTFLAECSIQGRQVNAYTVAVEALDRPESFDADKDSIVRVEMHRLRRALDDYYKGRGGQDAFRIRVPPGGYAAVAEPVVRETATSVPPTRTARPVMLASVGGLAAIVVVLAAALFWRGEGVPERREAAAAPAYGVGNALPAIQVLSPEGSGPRAWSEILRREIADVVLRSSEANLLPETYRPGEADYRLTGFVDHGAEATRVGLELTDITGEVVWTQLWVGRAADASLRDQIVKDLGQALLQPSGVIRAREAARYAASQIQDPLRRCKIVSDIALFRGTREDHETAIDCMERLTAADSSWALGFAYLSMLYSHQYELGWIGDADGKRRSLALAAARRAVELDPRSSRAYRALHIALFNMQLFAPSFAAAEQAMQLDKFDLFTTGEYAARLIRSGDLDRGMMLLVGLEKTTAVNPCDAKFFLFLGRYLRHEPRGYEADAAQLAANKCPYSLLAVSLAALARGHVQQSQEKLAELVQREPLWRDDPRQALFRIIPHDPFVERLMSDLGKAGLAALNDGSFVPSK